MSNIKMDKKFFDDMIKDTGFRKVNEDSTLMHSRPKLRTPLLVINCIYGGGIPLGTVGEISGPPEAGKSTFLYQCVANYQEDYKNGVAAVCDMETSLDVSRAQTLGVDIEKLLRLPATSSEDAFSNIFKILNKMRDLHKEHKDVSLFLVYDSLGTGGTEKQKTATDKGDSAFNAGAMMEQPRILKQNLSAMFPYLEEYPIFLGLINQVSTQMGAYASSVGSGGGFGLKHLCHFHITFSKPQEAYEEGFLIKAISTASLKKSKLSPKMVDIPCHIDVTKGGKIDEIDSFVSYLALTNVNIVRAGSWYNIADTIDSMTKRYPVLEKSGLKDLKKNMRKNDFYALVQDNKNLQNFLQVALIDFINNIYSAQSNVNGEYKEELIKQCSYFNPEVDANYNPDDREKVIGELENLLQ